MVHTVKTRDSPPADTPPPKELMKPDRPIKDAYQFSMDKPPLRRALQKCLQNQIGTGRHHGFIRYYENLI